MTDLTENTAGNLITTERVNGTAVYNGKGEKLGHIEDVIIDKVSGRAIYAVLSFGGFLGIGEKQHPLPWATLRYDKRLVGYVVNLDRKALDAAPSSSPTTSNGRRRTAARSTPIRLVPGLRHLGGASTYGSQLNRHSPDDQGSACRRTVKR